MGVKETKEHQHGKNVGVNSGRSMSSENPTGVRKRQGGKELAPRSLRRQGRVLMSDCNKSELNKLGLS